MKQYESEFPCPSCRTMFDCDAVEMDDTWNADDALDALLDSDADFEEEQAEKTADNKETRRSTRVKK